MALAFLSWLISCLNIDQLCNWSGARDLRYSQQTASFVTRILRPLSAQWWFVSCWNLRGENHNSKSGRSHDPCSFQWGQLAQQWHTHRVMLFMLFTCVNSPTLPSAFADRGSPDIQHLLPLNAGAGVTSVFLRLTFWLLQFWLSHV